MSVTCYACEKVATTVEHVPARSFFPKHLRKNLITVPSCAEHNNALAQDVEYVRNIVSLMFATNETGNEHFVAKVLPSYAHSPALASRTFQDLRAVTLNGEPTGIFSVDLKRVDRVMTGIVRALHFRDTGKKVESWAIIPASMLHRPETTMEAKLRWLRLLDLFDSISLTERHVENLEVFRYASASNPSDTVGVIWYYRLIFYDGFVVKAFTIPEKQQANLPQNPSVAR